MLSQIEFRSFDLLDGPTHRDATTIQDDDVIRNAKHQFRILFDEHDRQPLLLQFKVYQPTIAYQLWHVGVSVICVSMPCFFMGVTFPLLCSAFSDNDRFPATLYGWNTLGACTGVLACQFLLLPGLGHNRTFALMAVVNIGLGLFFLLRRRLAEHGDVLSGNP